MLKLLIHLAVMNRVLEDFQMKSPHLDHIRTESGKELRKVYICKVGWIFLTIKLMEESSASSDDILVKIPIYKIEYAQPVLLVE